MRNERARDRAETFERDQFQPDAPVASPPFRFTAPSLRDVLGMQQAAGNVAVTKLLGRSATTGRRLSRVPAYRHGGKSPMNLTPRPDKDVPSGLSLTETPGKGWTFAGGKAAITGAGFEVQDDPTPEDPLHFLVRPGASQGATIQEWAATRPALAANTPKDQWHPLTQRLHDLAS